MEHRFIKVGRKMKKQRIPNTEECDCEALSERCEEAEKRLAASQKESASKSYFLAQATHDLEQPLHALRIFISLLKDTELKKDQQELVEKIGKAADNMYKLLENYLDLSKIEYGGVRYESSEFCIDEVSGRLAEEFSLICVCQQKEFHYIPSKLVVETDKILLERLLRNILSNAVKYAQKRVIFGCRRRGNFVQIEVLDDGKGISKKDIPHIFEEFYQSSEDKENKKKGSGLGLAIVKKIADIMSLDIKIRTKSKHGTSFNFQIPLATKKQEDLFRG